MTRLATIKLSCTAIDPGTPRKRWNGEPTASRDADAATDAAVEAFKRVLEVHGFQVAHTSYGVTGEVADE